MCVVNTDGMAISAAHKYHNVPNIYCTRVLQCELRVCYACVVFIVVERLRVNLH